MEDTTILSLDDVTILCKKFVSESSKPNIAPEYHRLHEGLRVLQLWENDDNGKPTILTFPIKGPSDFHAPTIMTVKTVVDKADVIVYLEAHKAEDLAVYERVAESTVCVVDVSKQVVIKIPSMLMSKSWCVRNIISTINPTPAYIYKSFFNSLQML